MTFFFFYNRAYKKMYLSSDSSFFVFSSKHNFLPEKKIIWSFKNWYFEAMVLENRILEFIRNKSSNCSLDMWIFHLFAYMQNVLVMYLYQEREVAISISYYSCFSNALFPVSLLVMVRFRSQVGWILVYSHLIKY